MRQKADETAHDDAAARKPWRAPEVRPHGDARETEAGASVNPFFPEGSDYRPS